MKQYLDLVRHVLLTGTRKENRTGVDTISTFNHNYEVDLRDGFPLLTTKAISWKNIVVEMLWFLSGQTDISILKRHGCKFWDAWADESGKVPSAYGAFWRQFPTHRIEPAVPDFVPGGEAVLRPDFNDQIAWVIGELQRNPMSRRMVISAWAPGNAQTSKLPPCHSIFMLNVQNERVREKCEVQVTFDGKPVGTFEVNMVKNGDDEDARDHELDLGLQPFIKKYGDIGDGGEGGLNFDYTDKLRTLPAGPRLCLHLTQRSADVFLGVPYNIASYALLLHLFSRFSGIEPGIFAHSLVDAHVYTAKPDGSMGEYDHVPALREQISRAPRPLPRLVISPEIQTLADVERLMDPSVTTEEVMRHFVLEGYDPWPALTGKVAV